MKPSNVAGQGYGSTRGIWRLGAKLILTLVGGFFCPLVIDAVATRFLPGLARILLYVVFLIFGVICMVVCARPERFFQKIFFVMFCIAVMRCLTMTSRMDILPQATMLSGTPRLLCWILCFVLTVAIGIGLLAPVPGGKDIREWMLTIVILVIMVFPTLVNSANAINVALDSKMIREERAEITQLRTEEQFVICGKVNMTEKRDAHYVTVVGNDLISEETELSVDEEVYSLLQRGDQVRLLLHPGAFGMPWLEVTPIE